MADTNGEQLLDPQEKNKLAQELYARGSRNYLVKSYSEAAEDLSQACEMLAELNGDMAECLGLPYLMYAKSLIAVAQQDEIKVVDVREKDENGEASNKNKQSS